MAFCASTRKELICLQKSDLRIYVVSNPGHTHLANQHLVEATQKAGSIIAETMRDDVTTC